MLFYIPHSEDQQRCMEVRRALLRIVLARHLQQRQAACIEWSVAVGTNLGIEIDRTIAACAKSFGLGWDHGEVGCMRTEAPVAEAL